MIRSEPARTAARRTRSPASSSSSSSAVPTDGTLSAPVEATYALADYREAIAHAARNDRNGKVLFAPG
jgi:hypothetical protein